MSEENKNTSDAVFETVRRVRIANSWELISQIDDGFFYLDDTLSNPISAAMGGSGFPDGTIVDLSTLVRSIMKFVSITPFEQKPISEQDEHYNDLHNELRQIAGEINILIGQLFTNDLGTAKGFKCIHDYAKAIRDIEQNKWSPLRDKILATLPKKLTEDELQQLQNDIDNLKKG